MTHEICRIEGKSLDLDPMDSFQIGLLLQPLLLRLHERDAAGEIQPEQSSQIRQTTQWMKKTSVSMKSDLYFKDFIDLKHYLFDIYFLLLRYFS